MKRPLLGLLIGAGALLTVGAFAIGSRLQQLQIYFEKAGKLVLRNSSIYLLLAVKIENPNKKPVTLQEIDLKVIYNGQPVGTIQKLNQSVKIPARSFVSMKNIESRIQVLSLVSELMSSKSKQFTITGTIKAEGITFPVNEIISA